MIIETEGEIIPEVVEKQNELEVIGSMGEAAEEELNSTSKHETREDKIFRKFKTKIVLEPEQIIAYGRRFVPIWISGEISFSGKQYSRLLLWYLENIQIPGHLSAA